MPGRPWQHGRPRLARPLITMTVGLSDAFYSIRLIPVHRPWMPSTPLYLRTPPIAQETRQDSDPASVSVRIFPTWFTCEGVPDPTGGSSRRRRLVPWGDLEANGGRKKYRREDGLSVDVTPIR